MPFNTSFPEEQEQLFSESSHPQLHCMALNIYHEARADNIAGKYAVADVVLNRVHDDRWPSTVCDVVKEGPISKWWKEEKNKEVPIRHRCQFSWYCDGMDDTPHNKHSWRDAQEIAYNLVHLGVYRGITEGATHYHATYVNPKWNKRMQNIGRIGAHIFFRAP
jgi:spore germination cell wall hydrolase CwlJ-like protein